MTLDNIDLKILIAFSKLKEKEEKVITKTEGFSSWKAMRNIFPKGKSLENMGVKQRLNRMSKDGLFKINGESNKTYTLLSDKVVLRQFTFPCGRKNGLAISEENKWTIFQL